jgi:hypothetical protein
MSFRCSYRDTRPIASIRNFPWVATFWAVERRQCLRITARAPRSGQLPSVKSVLEQLPAQWPRLEPVRHRSHHKRIDQPIAFYLENKIEWNLSIHTVICIESAWSFLYLIQRIQKVDRSSMIVHGCQHPLQIARRENICSLDGFTAGLRWAIAPPFPADNATFWIVQTMLRS